MNIASARSSRFRIRVAPHIHLKVKQGDRELLTTQLMVRGHAGNARENIFNRTRDLIDLELILVDFKPVRDSKIGELAANFQIVLGRTLSEESLERGRCPASR